MHSHHSKDRESRPHAPRAGFTLVELLVVVAIIAVLAALGTWGAFAMVGVRQQRNTELTIKVVHKLLQNRWDSVITEARKEAPSAPVLALAGGEVDRARVIWIKVRLAEAFPMTYAETTGGPGTIVGTYIVPASRRKAHFNKYQQTLGSLTGGTPGESSACLLMALKTLQGDATAIDDQIKFAVSGNDGAPGYVGSVNQINCLVDSFGGNVPLDFVRFFTGAPNPAPTGSRSDKFGDATDPDGRLLNLSWLTPNGANFGTQFHPVADPTNSKANFVIPMIRSRGRDRAPNTADDIFSYKLIGD